MIGDIISFISMIFSVALICIVAYFATRYLGRFGAVSKQKGDTKMRIYERLAIAPNKYLLLVKLGDKWCVLGVSNDRISLITEIDKCQTEEWDFSDDERNMASFSDILSQIMKNKK